MPLIKKFLIPGLIITIIIIGGVIIWKISSQQASVSDSAPSATLKANDAGDSITVPFSTPIILSWESQNVGDCFISGDVSDSWYSPVSNSGSQSIGKITKSTNYIFVCVDNDGKEVSDSIAISIDKKTIPSSISLADLFKDFQYFWKKDLCLGLKKDPDVVALQTALFFEGILPSREKITGDYDDDTFQAVKKFQENYGIIPSTGCVGAKTRAKLNELFYYFSYNEQPIVQEQKQTKSAAPATISFTADPASVSYNGSTTLKWSTTGVESCTASGEWSGLKATSGSEEVKNITYSKLYTLVCKGAGGSARKFVFITVGAAPAAPATISFTADPASVSYNGSTTLKWSTTGVESCTASGEWSGLKATSGSEEVKNITYKKTYVLTCKNVDEDIIESVVSVAPFHTYAWVGGVWGACSAPCEGGTQIRTATCKRSDGQTTLESNCTSPKLATSQTCNIAACIVDDRNYSGVVRHGEEGLTAPCGYRTWQVLSVSRSPKPNLESSAVFRANSGEQQIFNDNCDDGSYLYLKYDNKACRLYHRARTDEDCGYGRDSWNYIVRFIQ
jgi:peptidoglycan hydrolase-like protein with peptidoglycan-binding domain